VAVKAVPLIQKIPNVARPAHSRVASRATAASDRRLNMVPATLSCTTVEVTNRQHWPERILAGSPRSAV
jgi:hypothetical protein